MNKDLERFFAEVVLSYPLSQGYNFCVSSDAVKEARAFFNHTQKQAAELIGYTERAWRSWEAGSRTMRRNLYDNYIFRAESARHSENAVERGSAKEVGQE